MWLYCILYCIIFVLHCILYYIVLYSLCCSFWLIYCTTPNDVVSVATKLYAEAIVVPFMANFVVFAKRRGDNEAQLRVFCMTDDKMDKTLECQERFREIARSRDVEVTSHTRPTDCVVCLCLLIERSSQGLATGQGHCGACRKTWRLTDTDLCSCRETQTMSNIVESCPLTKLNGGMSQLHSFSAGLFSSTVS